jgi:hypothetical protein
VYATVCILILFLAFINLVYGIKFSRAQTTSWLLSVATGIFTGTWLKFTPWGPAG